VSWSTRNEQTCEPYILERFANSKWEPILKVVGKGSDHNSYAVSVDHYSGENRYRIKRRDIKNYRFSEPVVYYSVKDPVRLKQTTVKDELVLSEKASFEIYDSFGNLVEKGKLKKINTTDLEAGKYYLSLGNSIQKFTKK